MNMSEAFIQRLRTRNNRRFLYQLYKVPSLEKKSRVKLLEHATRENIEVLIRVLRLILTKVIPVTEGHSSKIRKSGKLHHLIQHFLQDESYRVLKADTLEKKKIALKHISSYGPLLHSLFQRK